MRPTVQGHDEGFMHHLLEEYHVARGLKDLQVVVVARRSREDRRCSNDDAPGTQCPVFGVV